jgi:hypothetical protein
MSDESEIVSLLEQDADSERTVSRHILRKVGDVENAILDLTKAVGQTVVDTQNGIAETNKGFGRLEDFVMTSQAALPRQFAEIAAAVMREELAKRKT